MNIISEPTATKEQLRTWVENRYHNKLAIDLLDTFWDMSIMYGVNPIMVYCQSMKETGYMGFGGVLDASFCNPCGLKMPQGGGNYDPNAHKRFDSWEDGIEAQVQHLCLYAGKEGFPISNPKDPRHFSYLFGRCKTVESLSNNWAGANYGQDIVKLCNEVANMKVEIKEYIKEDTKGMKIGVDMGHTLTGAGTGAVGVVKETDKNREVGKRLIAMLQEKGHTVINCTVDKSSNDLADRVAKANKQPLDLFISLHLNCFSSSSAHGVETFSYATTGKGNEYAKAIQNELVKATGWYNRGKKEANFYVLRKTIASAVLVELGFCSSPTDMAKWNTEVIAKALFKGITGKDYVSEAKPQEPPKPTNPNGVYRVIVGSYANKDNAIEMQDKLKKAGFDSFLAFYETK